MSNHELPNGWAETTLEEIARDVTYGYTAKSNRTSGGAKMLRITDIQDNRVDWSQVPFCAITATDKAKYLLKKWDLVFARTGATVGKSFLIQDDVSDSVFASYLIRVRCLEQEMTGYLSYFFNSPAYWDQITDFSAGIGQPNVNGSKLKGLSIPLAPLAEQKRIADKLEAVLGRVDACRARLDCVPALLKRFRQSVLASATSGGLTAEWRMTNGLNDEWETVPLQDAIDGIEQGWSPKCENEPSTNPTDWAVIKTTAIQEMAFLEYENKRLPNHLKPRPNLEIQPGDILITRAGPRVRAAVTCMVDSVRPRLIVCDKVYRFRAKKDKTTPNYLNVFLNSPLIVQELDEMKTGISDSGVNLTQSKFRALQIPLPTLPEQQEIVRRVEDLFAFADRIKDRLATAQKTVERLTPATLAKAFRGELVPQDPNDEPATALLDRLRDAPKANSSSRRRKIPK